ncbi:MAG: biosynthetic arginine decarboxylase [Planctomycetes bacterium]|nr:biosynthetic arginine decarboxylase [Planctomycetota bacterium]
MWRPSSLLTQSEARIWSSEQSDRLYSLSAWGRGYFRINEAGSVEVHPRPEKSKAAIDLKQLIDDLRRRGIPLPVTVHFDGILEDRVEHIFGCFKRSIGEYGYKGRYRGVYPIKVNQHRQVVDVLLRAGKPHGLGLEVGSKPELLAVLALLDNPDALLICNGYKDRVFLETALLATRLGHQPVIVIERFTELVDLIQIARDLNIRPVVGLRAKLMSKGSGKWESSGGERSKFGLTATEMTEAVELMRREGMLDCLQLLHFHLGSQITAIANLKTALREGSRLYVELCKLGANMKYLDVGGGLGVDYDGSRTNFVVSKDYSDQEYANDVVWLVQETCDGAGVPHPDLISESGRALVAHHSVLVVDVMGANMMADRPPPAAPAADAHPVLKNLWEAYQNTSVRNCRETFHDIASTKDEIHTLFMHGILTLKDRAYAEELDIATRNKVLRLVRKMDEVPEEFEHLERDLADTYFCNFSIFQSLPDTWAIKHLFPTMPISGHKNRPSRHAVLADITCDSDGKVDRFIDLKDVKETLLVHAVENISGPYELGFFLVGAYQEILGDPHNLFGDTSAVHVDVNEDGSYDIRHLVEGDRVSEVLSYVEYSKRDLMERVRRAAEAALKNGRITFEESGRLLKRYEEGMESYTYLSRS